MERKEWDAVGTPFLKRFWSFRAGRRDKRLGLHGPEFLVNMKRYQRLAVSEGFLGIKFKEKWVRMAQETPPPDRPDLVVVNASQLPYCSHLAGVSLYLAEDYERSRFFGDLCLQGANQFFFGKWRSELINPAGSHDPEWWRTNHPWMTVFEGGVMWAAVLKYWDELKRIAEYPDERCQIEIESTPQDKSLFFGLRVIDPQGTD